MPKVRKLTGNYQQMLEKMFSNIPGFVEDGRPLSAQALVEQLLKDLNRSPFFPTNKMTYDDMIATWMAPTTSTTFSQGDITASFFELRFKLFIMEKFASKPGFCSSDNIPSWSFAYFDDDGVPCGVCISYSKLDPSLWTAAIIRNTVAEPKDREVLVIAPEEFLASKEEGSTNGTDPAHTFLEFLRSKELKDVLNDGVFLSDGNVSIDKLNKISAKHKFELPPKVAKKVEKLKEQANALATLTAGGLSYQQFIIIKDRIEAKQKSKLQKLETKYHEDLRALRVPALDTALKQSFLRRNAGGAFVTTVSTVALIGAALALSGVGIALIGTAAIMTAIVTAVVAGIGVIVGGAVMGFEEKALSDYQVKLGVEPGRLKTSYEQRRQRQEALVKFEVENDLDQILRAMLAADFSGQEFTPLLGAVAAAKEHEPEDTFGYEFGSVPVDWPPKEEPASDKTPKSGRPEYSGAPPASPGRGMGVFKPAAPEQGSPLDEAIVPKL